MRKTCACCNNFLVVDSAFFLYYLQLAHKLRNFMAENTRKKPLNLNLTPRLRRYIEEFVRQNERKSAVAVIEEALREFFKARGINVDVPAEEILRSIVDDDRRPKRGKHA